LLTGGRHHPGSRPVSKPKMKLLVLAQVPPPAHGQSLAVAALLQHLRANPEHEVHHVGLRLSRDSADIGRWRPGKIVATLGAALRAAAVLLRHGPMPLYYVPAPGQRGALYRDWAVLLLCRPFASGLILHWHAVGLGAWLEERAWVGERAVTRLALGGAALALVQAEAVAADARALRPQRIATVRNGVPDPAPDFRPRAAHGRPATVIFVGLGCAEKGLFDAAAGVRAANRAEPGAFRFVALGPWASAADEARFRELAAGGEDLRHAGFVSAEEKHRLLAAADLFCFPSYYPHEGQPAALLEALAHDLPIVTTRWRGIPENLPAEHVHYVAPRAPDEVARALFAARAAGPAGGALRGHFLKTFTADRHLADLQAALASVSDAPPADR